MYSLICLIFYVPIIYQAQYLGYMALQNSPNVERT